jgi:hypothetical protein
MSTWDFRDADLRRHVVTFEHHRWTGWQVLTVDGREIARERKRWESGSQRTFAFDGHDATLRIVKRGYSYEYLLMVDGQLVQSVGTTLAHPGDVAAASGQAMADFARDLETQRRIANGGGWFYWIAGASLVNAILYHTGSSLGFPIGAVFGFLVEGIATELDTPLLAWIGHAAVVGAFWVVGQRARRGSNSAFVVGGLLYLLDTLIVLALIQDVLFVGFHALGLWGIYNGRRALTRSRAAVPAPAVS